MALTCHPTSAKAGSALKRLAAKFRRLPVPVIGRLANDALVLDLRCLEDEPAFIAQLDGLTAKESS
jgi:L-seryl-tRNA(Ser) seleniumtransferase